MSELVATSQQGLVGKYQPYQEYKDSGVEWLGNVPSHWTVTAVKRFASFTTGWTPPTGNDAYFGGEHLWANISDVGHRVLSTTAKTITDAGVRATRIKKSPKGSLLFSFKLSIGLVSIVGEDMYTNEAIATFLPSETFNISYMYWAAPLFIPQNAEENIYGAKLLNQERIDNASFVLPTPKEQQTIASFLDYETARIDRLIAQQQRLIELLKEKRQAVISHAVTKGLNPDAPMKDSGVEWIGQVPEHWQCVPFGLLVSRADLGGNYLGGQEENGIPFLKMGNLGRGCIVLDKLECLEEGSSFDDAHRLSMGDFLFNTRNSLDLVGKVAVWHDELEFALYNSNLLRVRFKKDFISSPDFMGFVFNSSGALGWLALLAKGTTSVAAIYYKDLRSMVVPIPPVDEQNAISSFISKCLSRLDTLEEKAIQSINLMNERRTALISAAVTGKIDLRGWTPPADEVAA